MEKLGFVYAELSAGNERLVYCVLKGFLRGPYEHRAAVAVSRAGAPCWLFCDRHGQRVRGHALVLPEANRWRP